SLSTAASAATHEVNAGTEGKNKAGLFGKVVGFLAKTFHYEALAKYATKNKIPLAIAIGGYAAGGIVGAALALVVTVTLRNAAKDLFNIGKECFGKKAGKEGKPASVKSSADEATTRLLN
ncbi:MAG TPA: hypothetical protein VFV28_07620, partial [Limnobacter sp.]|nr:hypothetical protein [Limnobacter sp.]